MTFFQHVIQSTFLKFIVKHSFFLLESSILQENGFNYENNCKDVINGVLICIEFLRIALEVQSQLFDSKQKNHLQIQFG